MTEMNPAMGLLADLGKRKPQTKDISNGKTEKRQKTKAELDTQGCG